MSDDCEEKKNKRVPSTSLLDRLGKKVSVTYKDETDYGVIRRTEHGVLVQADGEYIVFVMNTGVEVYIKFDDVRRISVEKDR